MKNIFIIILFSVFYINIFAQDINIANLKKDVSFLASDKLKGRATDTKGARRAAKYLAKNFKKIGLLPKGNDGFYHRYTYRFTAGNPHSMDSPTAIQHESSNVCAFIDNGATNTIVFGAHYDHLGKGHDGNSLDANPKGKIHNGADDNASGTSGLLALANYYQRNNIKEPYNFLFIAFSGEELGLFGSKKWCENPTIPLKSIHLMINMDMIGRLNEEKGLLVSGVGTAPELYNIVGITKGELKVKTDSSGIGPSDYTSFYLKDIPVLAFFTGQHSDYHKPSDDTDKINFQGMQDVLAFIIRVTDGAMTFPKFQFTKTKNESSNNPSFKVTLGIMPDYVFDGKGLRIDGVTDGKPAFKAGLKAGDIIIELGNIKIENIQDYMGALSKFKKGESTTVKVIRDGKIIESAVTY